MNTHASAAHTHLVPKASHLLRQAHARERITPDPTAQARQ